MKAWAARRLPRARAEVPGLSRAMAEGRGHDRRQGRNRDVKNRHSLKYLWDTAMKAGLSARHWRGRGQRRVAAVILNLRSESGASRQQHGKETAGENVERKAEAGPSANREEAHVLPGRFGSGSYRE